MKSNLTNETKINRYYVKVPTDTIHSNHPTGSYFGVVKQINTSIAEKIYDLVALGIVKTHEIELLLEEYVRNIFASSEVKPSKFDRSWYPTSQDIKNHVHMSSLRQKLSEIDQVNLHQLIEKWQLEDPSRKFFFREFTGFVYTIHIYTYILSK